MLQVICSSIRCGLTPILGKLFRFIFTGVSLAMPCIVTTDGIIIMMVYWSKLLWPCAIGFLSSWSLYLSMIVLATELQFYLVSQKTLQMLISPFYRYSVCSAFLWFLLQAWIFCWPFMGTDQYVFSTMQHL